MQRQQRYYLLLLLCIGLFGCSSIQDFRGENKFKPRIKAFAHAIRWNQFEKAQGFIRSRSDSPLTQNMDFLNQIKVTKYESISKSPQETPDQESAEIISVYSIDYYHEDNFILKHQTYEQVWWYDDTIGTWFLDSDLPQFGR